MSRRPLPQLWLSVFLLLALAPRSPLSALVFSGAERVTPAIRQQRVHRAQPEVMDQVLAVLPDPAAVRTQVLGLGEVFTAASVLPRALAMFPKMSDIIAPPKLISAPDPEPTPINLVNRAFRTLPPPMVTTRAPTLRSELFQTLPPEILTPLSALIASRTLTMPLVPAAAPLALRTSATSLVPIPAPTALQTLAASFVPTPTSILSQIQMSSQIPAASLERTKASKSTQILAASLVPTRVIMSSPILSMVPTQTLTSSPKFLDASLVPTQTSQLIQTLTPSLVPIQTSVSFLPPTIPKKHPSTPALFPVLPQNLAVNMMPTQVSELSQTSSAPVVHTATPIQSSVAPHRRATLLVPAGTLVSPQTPAPAMEHTQIPTPLLQLPWVLPLPLVSGEAQNQPPQALGATQTLTPSTTLSQEWYENLNSTDAPPWILAPPPEFTIPLAPLPEPPPNPPMLYPPSPELTEALLPPPELKRVPFSVLSSKSIWTPTMLLNNTFPSPSGERHLAHTTVPTSLVSQKSIGEISFLCSGTCTCKAGMLSCTDLRPELRLHSVPVPGPKAHKLTFFFLDFHGNSISSIERGIWKSYPWAETLNLKDNALHKLHKNSFEGLLSLQYLPKDIISVMSQCVNELDLSEAELHKVASLTFSSKVIEVWWQDRSHLDWDLSCNKIHVIERSTFEPLPFLQFLNLSCNLLKKLSYGTFQAWHGMKFLQKLILNHNPLSAMEDTFFFQLSSLKYLDIGRTEVPLMTIENILVMTHSLQTLVLPINIACCLCQFKNNIESTFKTVKLQCESKCFTNSFLCDQKESIDHIQEEFIKALQSRKKNTSDEPSLQHEGAYVNSDINTLTMLNEQLNSNGEIDLLDAAKYLFPKLLRGQGKNVEFKVFSFINTQLRNGENTSGPSTTKTSWSSFGPIRINLTDEIELRRLYYVINLLEVYLQEKMYYIKNEHEKIVKDKYPPLRKKWKTFHLERSGKCGETTGKCSQPQASSSRKAAAPARAPAPGVDACKTRFCTKIKLGKVRRINNSQKNVKNKLSEGIDGESIQGKWESVKSSLENLAKGKTRASGQAVRGLKKPSLHHIGTPSTANFLATPSEDRGKLDGLTYPISASKTVNKRLKYKGRKEKHRSGTALQKDHIPILHSNNHLFHKAKLHVANEFPEAKQSQKMKNKLSQNRWLPENSIFTKTGSLMKNPSKKAVSFSAERNISTKASKRTTPAKASEGPSTRSTTLENTTASSKQMEEKFTLDNSLPANQKTNETHWKYQGTDEFLSELNGNFSFNLSASADLFEMELNLQLEPLIPNDALRSLISHVVRTLQKDCAEPRVQLACAKLISRTGHLMKLLSEQEKRKQSSANRNSSSGKHETNLSDSKALQKVLGQLQTDELTKDIPEFGYNSKLLLAISVTVVVMIIVAVICLIEIFSHRPTTSKGEKKASYSLWSYITSLPKKSSRKNHEEDGNLHKKGKPLWLTDMYRPLDATRKKNMAQKLHDQDSSDEEEIFSTDERNEIIGKKEEKRKNEG